MAITATDRKRLQRFNRMISNPTIDRFFTAVCNDPTRHYCSSTLATARTYAMRVGLDRLPNQDMTEQQFSDWTATVPTELGW